MNQAEKQSYFIKPGYRPNLVQASYDESASVDYWNDQRAALAKVFQYDVYKIAVAHIDTLTRPTVMDVGCGPPYKLAGLLKKTDATVQLVDQPNTADFASRIMPSAQFASANLETIDLNLGQRFDVIICADVIEHLVDPDPCLAFIRNHLAPTGQLFISTPERDVLRGKKCADSPHPMHVREWNRSEFFSLMESRWFNVLRQGLLPQRKEPAFKRGIGHVLEWLGVPPQWYSCQLAICGLRADRSEPVREGVPS